MSCVGLRDALRNALGRCPEAVSLTPTLRELSETQTAADRLNPQFNQQAESQAIAGGKFR